MEWFDHTVVSAAAMNTNIKISLKTAPRDTNPNDLHPYKFLPGTLGCGMTRLEMCFGSFCTGLTKYLTEYKWSGVRRPPPPLNFIPYLDFD